MVSDRVFLPDSWWSRAVEADTGVKEGVLQCAICGERFLAAQLLAALARSPAGRLWPKPDATLEVTRRKAHAVQHVERCEATLDVTTGYYVVLHRQCEPSVPASADFGF